MSIAGKLIEQDPADYLTVMNTDLIGAMHCAHEFGPVLRDNNYGRFIIIVPAAVFVRHWVTVLMALPKPESWDLPWSCSRTWPLWCNR
jgi:NAD(P)-dependent dehydrogenase (short-subunit alcohol dehydrogenase family)